MLIIAIDPGINGAICFFEEGEIKDVIDMPVMAEGKKNKNQLKLMMDGKFQIVSFISQMTRVIEEILSLMLK